MPHTDLHYRWLQSGEFEIRFLHSATGCPVSSWLLWIWLNQELNCGSVKTTWEDMKCPLVWWDLQECSPTSGGHVLSQAHIQSVWVCVNNWLDLKTTVLELTPQTLSINQTLRYRHTSAPTLTWRQSITRCGRGPVGLQLTDGWRQGPSFSKWWIDVFISAESLVWYPCGWIGAPWVRSRTLSFILKSIWQVRL